jgi:hypothetical protein
MKMTVAQSLAHEPRLQARLAIAHFAFDLGARRERRNRVDDENVNRAGPYQCIRDFERLFTSIWLRNQEVLEVDTKLAGIDRIKSMLGIDEGADATLFLSFRDNMQG